MTRHTEWKYYLHTEIFGSCGLTKHILNYSFITISMEKKVSVGILQKKEKEERRKTFYLTAAAPGTGNS